MPALIALFAILGVPFQESWLTISTPKPSKPRLQCEVVYVIPAEEGHTESITEALANHDGQWIQICRVERHDTN